MAGGTLKVQDLMTSGAWKPENMVDKTLAYLPLCIFLVKLKVLETSIHKVTLGAMLIKALKATPQEHFEVQLPIADTSLTYQSFFPPKK